ncbi:hypothetical protein N665_0246s0008 [Sinapis alba]|nr:hypothetical protein N665_0246s0008 [Sinapis alba]
MVHSCFDVGLDLIQCLPLYLLTLEQLLHHHSQTLHLVLRSSCNRRSSLLIDLFSLILDLGVLSLAENIGLSQMILVVPPLVPCVLSLTVLRVINGIVTLGVAVQMRIVPQVRVWVIVLELPSLPIHVANLMMIVGWLVCFRCSVRGCLILRRFLHNEDLVLIAFDHLINLGS